MQLNKTQVDLIRTRLKSSGVENPLVFDDFLDHICCMTEHKMEEGASFENSLEMTLEELPLSELKIIEKDTLIILNMETTFTTKTTSLVAIPFFLFGISWIADSSGLRMPLFVEQLLFISAILSMFVTLAIGWIKDFPRWSFPAIGFTLFFTIYFANVAVPSFSDELLGLWAFVPLLITLVICLSIHPSVKPLKSIINRINEDKSILLFLLYGFAPFFMFLLSDEIHNIKMLPISLIATALLLTGLYSFLRSEKKRIRVWSIILSGLTASAVTLAAILYWDIPAGVI